VHDERERYLVRYAGGFAPFVVARAHGAWFETTDGRRILDFTSGQICSTLGHNHPRIAQAIKESLETVSHLNSWMLSEPVLALAERLAGLFPPPLERVMLLNTGSEANEVALKLAKLFTGRWEVGGLTRSFHGLLAGIASVNFSMGHGGYGPLLPGAFALPAPYAYRCPVRHCDGACDCTCLETGFELVDQQSVGSLCAVVAEPVLSAGGIIVPPDGYLRRLRELCDERGMLLVMDEAQTGFGRLGTMFGFEHDADVPDLVAVSKTLGGGVPLAATVTSPAVEEACAERGFLHVTSHVSDRFRRPRDSPSSTSSRKRASSSGRVFAATTSSPASASSRRATSRSATCADAGSSSVSSSSRIARAASRPMGSARPSPPSACAAASR
jgi:2,2-dialkylglycine decarboxylase (pyruvate)